MEVIVNVEPNIDLYNFEVVSNFTKKRLNVFSVLIKIVQSRQLRQTRQTFHLILYMELIQIAVLSVLSVLVIKIINKMEGKMKMEAPQQNLDWRGEVTDNKQTLKVKDGDIVEFIFADEGVKKIHADYGTSIAFSCIVNTFNGKPSESKEPQMFYVKINNYDLLGQIKALGTLTGLKARISRIGSTKSNTRYKIVKV